MPLPWKKTKPNRISRIVADLQPPSRVVETGFPTSVVDLFVKNRDRIKRHSLKKTKNKHLSLHVSDSVAPPPTPSLSPHDSPRLPSHEDVVVVAALDSLQRHDSTPPDVDFFLPAAPPPNAHNNANAHANANAAASSNSTSASFVVVAKIFLAVIPALTTKKLALGITLSAFLLFLLEIFGKFAASIRNRFFSTTGEQHPRLDGLMDRGGEQEEESPLGSAFYLNNEIQIVESSSDSEELGLDEGLQREAFRDREKGLACCSDLEVEKEEQGKFQVGKNERSRSAKLKAKIIKKLIPKKLRSGKRSKRNKKEWKNKTNEEMGIVIKENEQGIESSCEEEEEEEDWDVQQIWEPEKEEEEVRSSLMVGGKGEEDERKKKNWECIFVMLMILLGLCGGRFLALVLTLSGCFIFKFIKFQNHKWKFG